MTQTEPPASGDAEAIPPAKRPGPVTWVLLGIVLVFLVVAVQRNWTAVADDLRLLAWYDYLGAGLAGIAAALCSFLSWRVLLAELGHPLPLHPAMTMFFAGQLGKYVPGSVWTAAIQAEMGRQRGLRRSVIVMAYAVTLILSVATGAVVGALALLGVTGGDNLPVLGLVLVGAVVVAIPLLRPNLANRLIAWLAAKRGRELPRLEISSRTLAEAAAAGAAAWGFLGLHIWFLARALGAGIGDLPAITGAFALAFVAGLLVVPLPAGAGIREGVLTATLAPLIGASSALTVSLVSRLVLLAVDLLLALAVGVPGAARRMRKAPRPG